MTTPSPLLEFALLAAILWAIAATHWALYFRGQRDRYREAADDAWDRIRRHQVMLPCETCKPRRESPGS